MGPEIKHTESLRREFLKELYGGRRKIFGLRMAPMIDIIFLLLIFFLVAGNWRPPENFLPFQLPKSGASEPVAGRVESLVITISETAGGCQVGIGSFSVVRLDDRTFEADMIRLMKQLQQCMDNQKRFTDDPVELIFEPEVKWEHVTKTYNVLYGAGLTDITFRMTE
ncbi:MAG: biopolymer transporter ExbD [Planctomycetota bacterium]